MITCISFSTGRKIVLTTKIHILFLGCMVFALPMLRLQSRLILRAYSKDESKTNNDCMVSRVNTTCAPLKSNLCVTAFPQTDARWKNQPIKGF